jgi:hypothetical protein
MTRSGFAASVVNASSASCRPALFAVRKKILSSCWPGHALSSGNSVPTVLPMPVGACAATQRFETAER